jgi:hypothetical protein
MAFRGARHTTTENKIMEYRMNLFSYLFEVVDVSKTRT